MFQSFNAEPTGSVTVVERRPGDLPAPKSTRESFDEISK